MKLLFALITLILLISILWWPQDDKSPITAETQRSGLQAYMNNFTMKAMDTTGTLALQLTANSLKQYDDRQLAILDKPVIQMIDDDTQWQIQSGQGHIDQHKKMIDLSQQVVITQIDSNQQHLIEIRTDTLNIDVEKQLARSDDAVQMTTHNSTLHANGMVLDKLSGKLQLLANVRGVVHAH